MPRKLGDRVYDAFIFKTGLIFNNALPVDRLVEKSTFCEWRVLYASEDQSILHGFVQLKHPATYKQFRVWFPEATYIQEYSAYSYADNQLYATGGQTYSFGMLEV